MWEEVFNAAFSAAAQMADAFAHSALAQHQFASLKPLEMAESRGVHDHRPILSQKFWMIKQRVVGHRIAPIN